MGADVAAEEHFGPYLVYERLGVGGMATVHRALERDASGHERIVALKRLLPHLAEDASFIKSFVREAKLASYLSHVNIVQIYELGRVGTEYFISMEYIDGYDIRRVLRHARKVTGPPPINITVGLMLQLCDALDFAHTRVDDEGNPLGLVHRDVSPSNLLVTGTGNLKVIDFGIARAQSSQLRTQTGRVKGKLAYMAPEAVSGSRELDARSDIWAAGVILHELLTARPLFASKNEYQTLLKVQRGDLMPPSTFNQGCPPELDAIVFKALARDPDERFSGADEMRAELDDLRHRYALQTSLRDVAKWIDWAFAQDTPTPVPTVARSSRPIRNRDDDEAVEIAWGGNDRDQTSGPLVLDDVPDVSEKHLARPDADEILDNLPTPQPTNARRPPTIDPVLARGTDRPAARASRPTNPVDAPNLSDRMAAQRVRDSQAPDTHAIFDPVTDPIGSADERAKTTVRPDTEGMPITDPIAQPLMSNLSADELFGPDDDAAATLVAGMTRADPPRVTPPVAAPVVRFSKSQSIPALAALEAGRLEPLRPPPQTRPGVQPASAHVRAPMPKPSSPIIASPPAVHTKPSRRGWWMLAGLVILGGAATAVTLVLTTSGDPVPVHETGLVKFVIEPADSEIKIEGMLHTGSPWSTELPSGTHQIEIRHASYKARVMSIELSPKETQTFQVVLEPLGAAATGDATLSVSSTPAGLEVVLDGVVQTTHTPIKIDDLKPGAHTIAIRRNGAEIWRQTINAEPSSEYELNPSFTAAKQRERVTKSLKSPDVVPQPAPAPEVAPGPAHNPDLEPPDETPADAQLSPTGALTVPPTAVTKLAGDLPNIAKLKTADLPAVLPAKVCIDTLGAVSSVDIIPKIDRRTADDLVSALQTWHYTPYKKAGVALSVCFVVTLRLP